MAPTTQPPKALARGLTPEVRAQLEAMGVAVKPWNPAEIAAVMEGNRTLGDLANFSKERQFQVAAMGLKLMKDGLREKAQEIFEGLEALDPYDAYVQVCLGTLAFEDDDFATAEDRFTRALFYNPTSVPALASRGELRLKLGRRQEGIADLSAALAQNIPGVQDVTARARVLLEAARSAK
jgi:tetratricopeptide (TPR) repeat protein